MSGGNDPQPLGTLQILDQVSCTTPGSATCTDTLPLSAEEPFTLETLGQLIRAHKRQCKTLILARVETVEGRMFYYSAHQLNKVIFRKFGKEGEYLFRLYALNPLTNTEIVGDVRYFAVEAHDDGKDDDREEADWKSRRLFGPSTTSLRQSYSEMRRNSMSTLMRNSLGSRRSSIRVAEVAGPVDVELQGIAAASAKGSMDLKVEISRASRGDLAIMQTLDRLREERERKVEQDALTKRLKTQLKDRREKIKQKTEQKGDGDARATGNLQSLRSASLENLKLPDKEVRLKSAPDLSRMASYVGDLPVSMNDLHTSLSVTSLSSIGQRDSSCDQSSSPVQRHLSLGASNEERRFVSTPDGLNAGSLKVPSTGLTGRRLSSPNELNTFLSTALRRGSTGGTPDTPTFKLILRPKTMESVRKSDDALTGQVPSPVESRRKPSIVSTSGDMLNRYSASKRVEFVSPHQQPPKAADEEEQRTVQRTLSGQSKGQEDDMEAWKAELQNVKSASHESVAGEDQAKGWRLAARKLSTSLGNGLDGMNRLRSRSVGHVNRDSQHRGSIGDFVRNSRSTRRSKSGKGGLSPSTADLRDIYKAVFIGTDDDFLQRACVRKMFELNALETGDASLFEIPTEVLESEGIDLPNGLQEEEEGSAATLAQQDPYHDRYQAPTEDPASLGSRPWREFFRSGSIAHFLGDSRNSLSFDRKNLGQSLLRHRTKLLAAYLVAAGTSLRFSGLSSANLYIAIGLASAVFIALGILLYVLHRPKSEVESEV
ncbi:hypothetical protein SpCBS45565_g03485 [Spizellomyces sp. 'palustris']|nr:hypothetical protein SpCBS45565_g03485 [Spizellomyces sp. 'palustris']